MGLYISVFDIPPPPERSLVWMLAPPTDGCGPRLSLPGVSTTIIDNSWIFGKQVRVCKVAMGSRKLS